MAGNALKEQWAAGEPSYGVWCAIPSSYVAEACAHQGFDYVCVDLQHGMIDYPVATEMILAIYAGGSRRRRRMPAPGGADHPGHHAPQRGFRSPLRR